LELNDVYTNSILELMQTLEGTTFFDVNSFLFPGQGTYLVDLNAVVANLINDIEAFYKVLD
jgi:hypothetical protein